MEGAVIEVAKIEVYFNKGKRCAAVTMHDGSIVKLVVTSSPAQE